MEFVWHDLLRNGKKIFIAQDKEKNSSFRFGMDAVLLSRFVKTKPNDFLCDLGTGTGILSLLLADDVKKIEAIDCQEKILSLAEKSLVKNSLQEKIFLKCINVKNIPKEYPKQMFDVVVCNPPYYVCGNGKISKNVDVALARHEIFATFDDFCAAVHHILKLHGKFFLIHIPERLHEIFLTLKKYSLAPKTIRLVQPNAKKNPCLVLIEAVHNGKFSAIKFLPTCLIRDENNQYTEEFLRFYE